MNHLKSLNKGRGPNKDFVEKHMKHFNMNTLEKIITITKKAATKIQALYKGYRTREKNENQKKLQHQHQHHYHYRMKQNIGKTL